MCAWFQGVESYSNSHGFNHLLVFTSLYTYTETSTLQESLDTADMNDCRRTQHAVKISMAPWNLCEKLDTEYTTILTYDTRNSFFLQVGGMKFLKQCFQAPLPFPSWIPPRCPLALPVVPTDWVPGTSYLLDGICLHHCNSLSFQWCWYNHVSCLENLGSFQFDVFHSLGTNNYTITCMRQLLK